MEEKMKNDKEGMQGTADPKILNAVAERPDLEMLSEAGKRLIEHTVPPVDWKKAIGDRK
jgi:hypothetical protein